MTTIDSVSQFYLRLVSRESQLEDLAKKIAQEAKTAKDASAAELVVGAPCLAMYAGEWYRGVVVNDEEKNNNSEKSSNDKSQDDVAKENNKSLSNDNSLSSPSHVAIFFPDYGNTEFHVPTHGGVIKQIPPSLISTPAFAIQASLIGILSKERATLDGKFADIMAADPVTEATFISGEGAHIG